MKAPNRVLSYLALACLVLGAASVSFAQSTTGSLSGLVTAKEDNAALPGAQVTAVHEPTATRYTAVTGADGRFRILNVRVGGPYTVSAAMDGFHTQEATEVFVKLGADTNLAFELQLATITETVTVVAEGALIDPSRTGSTSNVSTAQIENLPTVRRGLQDFARTNPYFVVDAQDPSATRINVAGRNNRYNSIQIDGAVNNDLFGLADTGTPGGQADTQPVSLDAVQELQLVVSPYDVRQGGFTGGAINAVTRSGSNDFHGSAYGSTRDESNVGDGPFDRPVADFSEDQYGFRLGGPISRDRLFFFVNGELNRRDEPTGVSADGSTGTVFFDPAGATELHDFLVSTYSYDPGTLGDFAGKTDSDLAFGRLDWNLADSHQVTLRHNYVKGDRDVIANRSFSSFRFDTAQYAFADKTNSTVLQVNSVLGPGSFNEGRLGFQTIRDVRAVPVIFPSVEIGGTGPRRGALHVGTERFSGANALDQDVLEITDDFTFIKGAHTVTVGTHNEIFTFKNLFLSDFYGYYYFPTLADFEAGTASEYSISFANGADPRRATEFEIRQYGAYVGDQWQVSDRLSLSLGLRIDKPDYVDSPSFNPDVLAALGYDTSSTPSDDIVVSPRFGFNWDPDGQGTQQVRGGVGVFAGRTPYVWVSNGYANTGIEATSLSFRGSIPFIADPLNQPRDLGSAGTVTVDLLDPGFELPRVLRATVAYDRQLPWNVRGTAEVVWSQTQKDVFYMNVNKVQTGTSPLDGRPTFSSVSSGFRDALLLTNTGEGEEKSFTLQFVRPFTKGLTLTAAWAYMDAESALDGTSSRAISNWQFRPTPGDIFHDDVATSAFEMKNRFTASASYSFDTGPVGHTVALFFNAQSGRPYSLLIGGDPNRDGYTSNDQMFVPASADAIILLNSSGAVIPYSVFADYLTAAGVDPTAGRILDRNSSREPWSHLVDFHYALEVPIKTVRAELTFDVLNLLNLIDSEKGVVEFVNFQTTTPVNYVGQDAATGKPIYREAFSGALTPGRQFSTSDLRSRWQAKLGLRVTF